MSVCIPVGLKVLEQDISDNEEEADVGGPEPKGCCAQ